jgi:maltooligosyltrehalose synthase
VLAAVGVRAGWEADTMRAPAGRWRDVLSGGERELREMEPLGDLLDERGLALLER